MYVGYPKGEWVPSWLKKHDWGVDLSFVTSDYFNSDTGSGKREIVPNGVYDSNYQIVIPEELKNYE